MIALYVRVNGETRGLGQTNIIECAKAKVPLHVILAHAKRFPKDILRFEAKAAAVIPLALAAHRTENSDGHIAECLRYLIYDNARDWFEDVIEDIESVTLDITLDEVGLSILNETRRVEWADLSAMARIEFQRRGEGPTQVEEPLYVIAPPSDRERISVTLMCNGVMQTFSQAPLRVMKDTVETLYNRHILPRLTEEALGAPSLPPRDVHMIAMTEIVMGHISTLRDCDEGMEDKTPEEKIATYELMSIVARLILTESKKLSSHERKHIRSAFINWEFEGEAEAAWENWLGERMNILGSPFKLSIMLMIGGRLEPSKIRETTLFEFPTAGMKAVWSATQTEDA